MEKNEKGIFDAVLQEEIDFDNQPWPSISSGAKDLVHMMLIPDLKKRITGAQVLAHPWLKEGGEALDRPLDNAVLSRMKQFRAMNKLKKLALKVIVESLNSEEIQGLKAMFENMDTDKSGTITYSDEKWNSTAGQVFLGLHVSTTKSGNTDRTMQQYTEASQRHLYIHVLLCIFFSASLFGLLLV